MIRKVYFDHSATTPLDKKVLEKMLPYFSHNFGNASSVHTFGREAKIALGEAREMLAWQMNAHPGEIIFTGGGTESDNLAIKGLAFQEEKRRHIITSKTEHHAVLKTCEFLEKHGFRVTYLPVDQYGLVSPAAIAQAITEDTFLISIMHANNEVGTINPVQEIGRIAREKQIYFHCDAVQTFGKIPVDVQKMNIDLLSVSGHKIYGPKGVGALFIRKGIRTEKIIHGGHHEYNRRAGTENIPAIVGFAEAVSICREKMGPEAVSLKELRDNFHRKICNVIPEVHLNGHPEHRLPGHLNLTFKGIEGEALLLALDLKGLAASSGSACTAGTTESSHVLSAMGISPFLAQSSIRFTLGRSNSIEDIEYTIDILPGIVERLRKMSPFS